MQTPATDLPPDALLDAAFEHAGVALCLLAPDGTILRANAEWLRSTGLGAKDAIGADVLDLFPEVRRYSAALYARAMAGERVDIPRRATRFRGVEVWWEGRLSRVPFAGGTAFLITAIDVTAEVARQRADQAALRESASFLRRVIDLAPNMVFVKDRQGRFVLVNEALARCYGAQVDAVVGKTDADFNPDAEQLANFRRADLEVMESRTAQRIAEEPVRHSDGQVRWYTTVKVPLVRDDGTCDHVLGVATDITELRRMQEGLEETEQRFRFLANAMPQIVCVLGPDGRVEYVNPGWSDYSGLDAAATRAAGWETVLHPDDLAAAVECRRRVLKRLLPQEVELRYRARDGSYRWFLSRVAPIVERGRVVRLVGAAMDIEDRKRALEALRTSEQLLRDADRRKDEFLRMLSHELRNPLAPIRSSLFILDHAGVTAEQARRAKEVAKRQLFHLTRLVDDLLDVTRISRGKVELRRAEVDLTILARRTAEDHRALMQDRQLALAVEVPERPVVVRGDETRLTQVLGNLLHNAAKFTPAGGRVTLALAADARQAVIHVRDTGAGIEPEMIATIFEPFTQAKQTLARSEGGLGLGLALVKGLIALHGGDVSAFSAGHGRGTDFVVTLPLAERAELFG
jgi:PAS domain S-box-containing protein